MVNPDHYKSLNRGAWECRVELVGVDNMRKYLISALCVGAAFAANPAQAVVVVNGFSLDEGSFGAQTGVHSSGAQSDTEVTGFVNGDGSGVTFTSSDILSTNGSGEAVIEGPMADLNVAFEKAWDNITFSFAGDDGVFTLLVNGTSLFSATPNLGDPACNICLIGNGQNKFILSGSGITTLAFTFDPSLETARQFRVKGVSGAVPEPATWSLLICGFALAGVAMRHRKTLVSFA